MKPNQQLPDGGLRAYKWLLLLAGAGSLALSAWAEHRFFMHLPMAQRHILRLGGDAFLLVLLGLILALVLRYENKLAALNAELQTRNRALEHLEDTIDKRLIELAQALMLSLAQLSNQVQFALQSTTNLDDIKVFSKVLDEAHALNAVAKELIALKQLEATPETPVIVAEAGSEEHQTREKGERNNAGFRT